MKANAFNIEAIEKDLPGLLGIFNFSIKNNLLNKLSDLNKKYTLFLQNIDKISQDDARNLYGKINNTIDFLLFILEDVSNDKNLDERSREIILNFQITLENLIIKLEDKATGFDKTVEKLRQEGKFKTLKNELNKKLDALH